MTQTQATDSAATNVVQFEDHLNFARTPHAILYGEQTKDLTPTQKLFLVYLAGSLPFRDRKWRGVRFDSNETYATWLNVSTRQVSRTKKQLADKGLLKIQRRSRGQTKRSEAYQPAKGRSSDFIWINPAIFVNYKKFCPPTPCPEPPDNPQATPHDRMAHELDNLGTRKNLIYTTGPTGLSSFEKKVFEKFSQVAPSAKFNLPKFRELQQREKLKLGTMLNRLSQIEANPFLHTQCNSVAMIFFMKNQRSQAYVTARTLADSFHKDISRAKSQRDVDVLLAEVASARPGWSIPDVVHFFRHDQGYDPKPGAPAITQEGWRLCNQPPNPLLNPAETDEKEHIFGDIDYTDEDEHCGQEADTTKDSSAHDEANGTETWVTVNPKVPPADDEANGTETWVTVSPGAKGPPADQMSEPSAPGPTEHGSASGNPPAAASPTKTPSRDHVPEPSPPPEPPRPLTAAEVLARIQRLNDEENAATIAKMALEFHPTNDVVINHLLTAERLEQAA